MIKIIKQLIRTKGNHQNPTMSRGSSMYGISRSMGSSAFGGTYVNTPVFGPLDTNQYPNVLPYHSRGTLVGTRPTPPQFYPSQEPVAATQNTNARSQYVRATGISKGRAFYEREIAKLTRPMMAYDYSTDRANPVSTHMNYIAPIPSSMYLNEKKSIAVGKSGLKVGLPPQAPITTKNYYPSGVRTSLRRARSAGSVAPRKKGSIYNTSLRTVTGGWGALPRANY